MHNYEDTAVHLLLCIWAVFHDLGLLVAIKGNLNAAAYNDILLKFVFGFFLFHNPPMYKAMSRT